MTAPPRLIEPPLGDDGRKLTPEEGRALLAAWDAVVQGDPLKYEPRAHQGFLVARRDR